MEAPQKARRGFGRAALAVLAWSVAAGAFAQPEVEAPKRPGWTFLTLSDDTWVYVKDALSTGSIRKAWTLYDLPAKRERDGVMIMSVASLGEFNCAEKTTRTIEEAYHEEPGLAGKPHARPPITPTDWVRPAEGSVGSMKLEFACRPRPVA